MGASGGIHSRWKNFNDSCKVILFEPDSREFESLKMSKNKNEIVLNTALSDFSQTIDFNLCEKQEVSSAYLPNHNFLTLFPEPERWRVLKTIRIKADTLDNSLKKSNIKDLDFIKIDTQGYELKILNGSVENLDKVIGLELEVEFAPLYENQPLFGDVDSFVRSFGFELFDIQRYYWKRKAIKNTGVKKGQLVFGNALYFRSPENLLKMNNISEKKILRAINIYLAYDYLDLAQTLLKIAAEKKLITKEFIHNTTRLLSKYESKDFFNFRGMGVLGRLFEILANKLQISTWYSGTDRYLGNR